MKTLLHLYICGAPCEESEVYADFLSENMRRVGPMQESADDNNGDDYNHDINGDGCGFGEGDGKGVASLGCDGEGEGDGWIIELPDPDQRGFGEGSGDGGPDRIAEGNGDLETGNQWEQKQGIITLVKRN